jgi:hypothetical protein
MAALAADPAGSAQRLEQLRAAADDARKLIDEANAAQRELAAARAEHERVIAAERTAHDEQLARDRRGFEQETAQRKAVCVPKIRFCSIGDEGHRGQAVR